MNKSYNETQKNYMVAMANLKAFEEQEREIERQYILSNHIINKNGSIPTASWTIDDDQIADKAIEDCGKIVESSGLWEKILCAIENLKQAEDRLIEYGLEIIPCQNQKEKEILKEEVKKNYTTRKKVIDLTFRLDVRTVKSL